MGFTNRYKKDGCTSAKEINWNGISSRAKLDVPLLVQGAVTKKVAKCKDFDVSVDADEKAGKGRIVLKRITKNDIVVPFDLPSTRTPDARAIKAAKAEIEGYIKRNKEFEARIAQAKNMYKLAKSELAKVESTIKGGGLGFRDRSTLVEKMKQIDGIAEGARDQAEKVRKLHDTWYVDGPRKGVAPVYSKHKVDEDAMPSADKTYFEKALMQISADASKVQALAKNDVVPALNLIRDKIKTISTGLTKGGANSQKAAEASLKSEIDALQSKMEIALAGTKTSDAENKLRELKDENSSVRQQCKTPKIWKTLNDSAVNRIALTGRSIEAAQKTAKRIKKSVPAELHGDGNIPSFFKLLDTLVINVERDMTAAEKTLQTYHAALQPFKPG